MPVAHTRGHAGVSHLFRGDGRAADHLLDARARRARAAAGCAASAGAVRTRAWDLLREPMFRRLLFVNWLQSSSWDVHAFVLPVLGHDRGISASVIGSILGAFAIAAAVIRVVLPMIASRSSERSVILCLDVRHGGGVRRVSAARFGLDDGPVLGDPGLSHWVRCSRW
jgi:hypothetical protein